VLIAELLLFVIQLLLLSFKSVLRLNVGLLCLLREPLAGLLILLVEFFVLLF